MGDKLVGFILIIVSPLLIVVILYALFGTWNVVDINQYDKSTRTAIKYGGPIAAYLMVLTYCYQVFKRLFPDANILNPRSKKLLGQWSVTSVSDNGTQYKGDIRVKEKKFFLDFSGTFNFNTNYTADLSTVMSRIEEDKVHLVYRIRDSRRSGEVFEGYSILDMKDNNTMKGQWKVIGIDKKGTIHYEKK